MVLVSAFSVCICTCTVRSKLDNEVTQQYTYYWKQLYKKQRELLYIFLLMEQPISPG